MAGGSAAKDHPWEYLAASAGAAWYVNLGFAWFFNLFSLWSLFWSDLSHALLLCSCMMLIFPSIFYLSFRLQHQLSALESIGDGTERVYRHGRYQHRWWQRDDKPYQKFSPATRSPIDLALCLRICTAIQGNGGSHYRHDLGSSRYILGIRFRSRADAEIIWIVQD